MQQRGAHRQVHQQIDVTAIVVLSPGRTLILRGALPAQLPVQQNTRFDLLVNLRTARAIGIAVPQSVLLRATEVIE